VFVCAPSSYCRRSAKIASPAVIPSGVKRVWRSQLTASLQTGAARSQRRFRKADFTVLQMRPGRKKSVVLHSIRLSPEVFARTLTASRLGVLSKKKLEKAK